MHMPYHIHRVSCTTAWGVHTSKNLPSREVMRGWGWEGGRWVSSEWHKIIRGICMYRIYNAQSYSVKPRKGRTPWTQTNGHRIIHPKREMPTARCQSEITRTCTHGNVLEEHRCSKHIHTCRIRAATICPSVQSREAGIRGRSGLVNPEYSCWYGTRVLSVCGFIIVKI